MLMWVMFMFWVLYSLAAVSVYEKGDHLVAAVLLACSAVSMVGTLIASEARDRRW
jgi:hypothetical protein